MFLSPTRACALFLLLATPLLAVTDDFETGDFSAQPYQHDPVNPWQIVTLDGNQVAASAPIPDLTDSTLILERTSGAGHIRFRRKVSSESGYDYLVFYIDGQEVGAWSGEEDWQTVAFPIDAGRHHFEWRYEKDDFVAEGDDRAWIDDIDLPTSGAWVTIDDFSGSALDPRWTDESSAPLVFADSAVYLQATSGFSGPLATEALRIDLASLALDSSNGSAEILIAVGTDDGHHLHIQAHDDASLPLPASNGARVVGGNEATPGDYPWMAALVRASSDDAFAGQFCGGALIHPFWVVSAAHCVEFTNPDEIDVVIGAHRLSANDAERVGIAEIIVHPGFDSSSLDNDIALLRLERPSNAPTVPLAHPDLATSFAPGVIATVIGWGALSEGGSGPDELYEVEIPIVSNATANASVGGVTDNMIAAGLAEGGKDSCQGDSGGPFLVPNPEGGFLLAGLVSWGNGCARPAQYGIYTRVANFADWVASQLEGLTFVATLIAPDGSVAGPASVPVLVNGDAPGQLSIRLADGKLTATHNGNELAEFASNASALSNLAFRVSSTGGEASLAVDRVDHFDPSVPIPATLYFSAPDSIRVGDSISVGVDVLDADALSEAELHIAFDPTRFQVTALSAGALQPSADLAAANASGLLQILASANPARADARLLAIDFAEIAGTPGSTKLRFDAATTLGQGYQPLAHDIRVRGIVANDDFANAAPISGASGSLTSDSSEAGLEPDEPQHYGTGGASLWYAFTAPQDGQVAFDTIGSDFDTVLAAYTGASLATLALLTEDDDSHARQSEIRFFVAAGDLVYVAVDGWKAATGALTLNWAYSFVGTPPSLSGIEAFEGNFALPWIHSDTPWSLAADFAFVGASSLRSPELDDNESSSLSLLAEFAEGTLSFALRVDSEAEYDGLSFSIDGQEVGFWDGHQDWQVVSFPLAAGVHELRWTYSKDFSISEGADAAWIDQISLPGQIALIPFELATNLPPIIFFVEGFTGPASDIAVSNGTLADFADGIIEVSPSAEGAVTVTVADSVSATTIYDTTAPVAIIEPLDASPTSSNPLTFRVTFDEDVSYQDGLLSATNGSILASELDQVLVEPLAEGPVTVTLAAGAGIDAASNASLATSASVVWQASQNATQTLDLVAGWNWISFSVLPADRSVDSVLATLAASDGDEFKTAPHLGGSATYFEGSWFGNQQGVRPGVRYLLRLANSATVEIAGVPVDAALSIPIVEGWNWIGYTGQAATPINDALANFAASDGDEFKTAPSQGGTATYFGGSWFPADFMLRPDVGYLLRSATAGTLSFAD
jgi:hypothetical protein